MRWAPRLGTSTYRWPLPTGAIESGSDTVIPSRRRHAHVHVLRDSRGHTCSTGRRCNAGTRCCAQVVSGRVSAGGKETWDSPAHHTRQLEELPITTDAEDLCMPPRHRASCKCKCECMHLSGANLASLAARPRLLPYVTSLERQTRR